jgi:hypothetical protein
MLLISLIIALRETDIPESYAFKKRSLLQFYNDM